MPAGKISRRRTLQLLGAAATLPLVKGCGSRPDRAGVIVIGAGIAGTYAAWLLTRQGVDVLLVEGSGRIGGRLLTLDHLPGHPEAGGQTLDAMYARTLNACEQVGLPVYPRKPWRVPGKAVAAEGRLIAQSEWPSSPVNRLEDGERSELPDELANFYLDAHNPLNGLDDWLRPDARVLDSRTFARELQGQGASPEALRWTEHLYDGLGLENMSALFAYRKRLVARFGGGRFFRISGGSMRLPEALARELPRDVRFGQEVVAIRNTASGVEIGCADGARFSAPLALVSIPFSVVRHLRLDPAPPPDLAELIRTLPYNRITQVKLAFDRPFWEADGLPPAMVSDSLFEKVFATPAEDGELYELNCWLDGRGAAELDALPEADIGRRVVRAVEAARPSARGALRVVDVTSWGRYRFSRGCYHFWGPGQVSRLGSALQAPWGNVHWIGEHTATLQQGIEGAMESAEREVTAVLGRLGRA